MNQKTPPKHSISAKESVVIIGNENSVENKVFNVYINTTEELDNQKVLNANYPILKFTQKRGEDLEPKDILGKIRTLNYFHKDYYYSREKVDQRLQDLIAARKNVIITGKPLSGKSRAIFELLSHSFKDYTVYIASVEIQSASIFQDQQLHANKSGLVDFIDSKPKGDKLNFFIFDDLEKFAEINGLDKVLEKIIAFRGNIILSTCRSFEYEIAEDFFGHLINAKETDFEKIRIPYLNDGEKKEIEQQITDLPDVSIDQEVDDTIGSYFIGLSNMQDYYRKFKSNSLERKILWGYKCINFLRKKLKGDKRLIKEYSLHHQGIQLRENDEVILEQEWEETYHKLEEIGFLYVKDWEGRIEMEEIYLDKIVINKEIKRNRENSKLSETDKKFNEELILCNDILKTYQFLDADERRKVYTRLLGRIAKGNKKLKEDIYNRMLQEGIKPDGFTLNVLIGQEETIQDCEALLEKLISEGIPYNNHTLNVLIKKAPSFPYGYNTFKQFRVHHNIEINEFTLRVLCYKADNFFQAWEVYREFLDLEIYPTSSYFYYNLLKKTDSFKEAYDLYIEVERIELEPKPNSEFYNRVIQKEGGEYSLAWNLYKKIIEDFGQEYIEEFTIISLIKKAPNFEEAQRIFEMVEAFDGIKLMPTFFTNLIRRAPSFDIAEKIFKDLESRDIPISKEPLNTLMGKAPDFDTAIRVEQQMVEKGIAVDTVTLLNLVKKAETYDIAWATLIRFGEKEKHVIPSLGVFNALLNKLNSDFDKEERGEKSLEIYHIIKGLNLIETGIEEGYIESVKNTFDLLIRKFQTLDKKLEIIELAYEVGITFQEKKFIGAIQRCTRYEDVTKVCKTMSKVEVEPSLDRGFEMLTIIVNDSDYSADKVIDFLLYLKDDLNVEVEIVGKLFELFLQKCQSKADAEEVYHQIIHDEVLITPQAYINLIWIYLENSSNKQLAPIIEELELEIIKDENIPPEYFEGFLKRCTDYNVALQIYKEMCRWEITPNTKTFEILLDVLIQSDSYSSEIKIEKIKQLFLDALKVDSKIPVSLFDYLVKLRLSYKISDPNLRQIFNAIIANTITPSDFALEKIAWFNSSRGQKGFEQINSALKKFDEAYVIPYDRFISKCFRLNEAKKLFKRMVGDGVKPKATTFENMLWFASNRSEFEGILALMREHPVTFTTNLTVLLIKNAETDAEAVDYYEAFLNEDENQNDPTAYSYVQYCLVDKLESFSTAWKYYLKYYREHKKYNPLFFYSLSEKQKTFIEAKKLSKEVLKSGLKPSEVLLDNIMANYDDEAVWDLIKDYSSIKVRERTSIYHQLFKLQGKEGVTAKSFKGLLHKATNFQSVLNILRLINAQNIRLSENALIKACGKATSKEEIDQIISLAKAYNITIRSSGFFTVMINNTYDLNKVIELYHLITVKGLNVGIDSYCKTISNIERFNDTWTFFDWIKQQGKFPFRSNESNKRLLKALAKKSTTHSEIEKVYNEFIILDITPSPEVYRAVVSRTKDEEQVLEYLKELLDKGVIAGIKIKKALFEKKRSFQFDLQAFRLIRQYKGKVRDFRINLFVDKAKTYEDINALYQEMLKIEYKPTYKVYRKLILYSKVFERSKEIYEKIIANKYKVTDDIFRSFMLAATNIRDAKLVLEYNRKSGFPYSTKALEHAMSLVESFKDAQEVYQMAVELNAVFTNKVFDNFIAVAATFEEGKMVLEYNRESGLPYTIFTFEKAMRLTKRFEDALEVYASIVNEETAVSNVIFKHFIQTAATFDEAMQALALMEKVKTGSIAQLDALICNTILSLPGGQYKDAKLIFNYMKHEDRHYKLAVDAAKRLLERADKIQDLTKILTYFFKPQGIANLGEDKIALFLEKQMTFEELIHHLDTSERDN